MYHSVSVNDCKFHKLHPEIFALGSEDTTATFWDLRRPLNNPFFSLGAHKEEVFSIDFNPFNEFLVLTSCADGNVGLWDLRNLGKCVYSFNGHKNKCTKVHKCNYFS
jgi:WD40 repeat protein